MDESTGAPRERAQKIGPPSDGNETPDFRVDPEGELDYDELEESGEGGVPVQVNISPDSQVTCWFLNPCHIWSPDSHVTC